MSYDEHLISMAGGDGEPDLDAIQARITDCQTYKFGMRNADKLAHEDAPDLLALVRDQAAKLGRVRAIAEDWVLDPDFNEVVDAARIRAAITATEASK